MEEEGRGIKEGKKSICKIRASDLKTRG